MPSEVQLFISHYWYLAIFVLIFSQEIGIPNPIPNELVLMYSGYLAATGNLYLPWVVITSVSADLAGTSLLYIIFYFFGAYIFKRKPKWLPISEKRTERLKKWLSEKGRKAIFLGRITPFIRGYTSVICGLLQVKARLFFPLAFVSALTWSVVCCTLGWLLALYGYKMTGIVEHAGFWIIVMMVIVLFLIKACYFTHSDKDLKRQEHES